MFLYEKCSVYCLCAMELLMLQTEKYAQEYGPSTVNIALLKQKKSKEMILQ